MSPRLFTLPASEAVTAALTRFWVTLGTELRDARLARNWDVGVLVSRAGVSRSVLYEVEAGRSRSLEAVVRVATALGLRLDPVLMDPRKRPERLKRAADPVHSFMGEFEARGLRVLGYGIGLDEPYQHYQFAGRADLVAWDVKDRALLHIENRTRFPDFQEMAGSFNAKRAYLGRALAARLGFGRWESETHVLAALWSSEVLHAIRLRPDSFRSLCPDPVEVFGDWWMGRPLPFGAASTLVVIDPLAEPRKRRWIGLDEVLGRARARYRGYADFASRLTEAGAAGLR